MSELLEGVQKSFDKSTERLDKLSEDLNRLADLETELGDLSGSLNLAATNLRQLSRDHTKFLTGAVEANDQLKELSDAIGGFKPEQIHKSLDKINSLLNELQNKAASIQTDLESGFSAEKVSSSFVIKVLMFMFACQAIGFLALAYRLY